MTEGFYEKKYRENSQGNYPCLLDNCGCRIGHCDSKCREHNYVAENLFKDFNWSLV